MIPASSLETSGEAQLIELARQGDRGAFDELARAYYPRMLRVALRTVRHMDDAEDVVQQALTSAYVHLDSFRQDSSFVTWLTRITLNEALTALRRRRHQFVELDDNASGAEEKQAPVLVCGSENPEQRMLRSETTNLLHQSLGAVKPSYREAMRLRLLEDLSLEEIARRLKIPVNTVKVHLFRGRQAMKLFLQQRLAVPATA